MQTSRPKCDGSGLQNKYIAVIKIFYVFCSRDLDLDPMTFTHEIDPYSLEMSENKFPKSCPWS